MTGASDSSSYKFNGYQEACCDIFVIVHGDFFRLKSLLFNHINMAVLYWSQSRVMLASLSNRINIKKPHRAFLLGFWTYWNRVDVYGLLVCQSREFLTIDHHFARYWLAQEWRHFFLHINWLLKQTDCLEKWKKLVPINASRLHCACCFLARLTLILLACSKLSAVS